MKSIKTLVLSLTTLALATTAVSTASARDREWATAGRVLTGLAAVSLVARACEPPPVYTYPRVACAPVVACPPIAYVQPAPVVVYESPVYVRPALDYRVHPVLVETSHGFGHRHGHVPAHFCR